MELGYDQPLYILPFDHRESYLAGLFHLKPPLSAQQQERVAQSKELIYRGFREALTQGVSASRAGLLVDEQFGAAILEDARRQGYLFALPIEKSGQELFDFEYGDQFTEHIEKWQPTFVKVLVRYNPDHAAVEENRLQEARLKRVSDYCRGRSHHFMFELLVPATPSQLEGLHGDKAAYDATLRPDLMVRAIEALQDAGVEPDIWKLEGLDSAEHYRRLVASARRDGRDRVGCIVLGRGADDDQVERWLRAALGVPGMIGFAVGRTCFWEPVASYVSGGAEAHIAAGEIARRYRRWVDLFESGGASRPAEPAA